jgi:protein TonB
MIEGLLLLALLFLTPSGGPKSDRTALTVVNIQSLPASRPTPERAKPQQSRAAARPSETPPPQPAAPAVNTQPPPVIQLPAPPAPAAPQAPPAETPAPPAPPRQVYGPPAPGPDPNDTAVVGTAPNGEPLYAAAWYREPYPDELRGYLSTAQGPGWALIACRTVPDFRVEDCVGLNEAPEGSNILRSVLAAAWQFRVRPPRRGGKLLWGAWVRIRIDYMQRIDSLGPSRR